MAEEMTTRQTTRPDPDPTTATHDLVDDRIKSLTAFVNARLDAIEAAGVAFREDLTRVPTTLDKALTNERAYNDSQMVRVTEHAQANFNLNTEKFAAGAQARVMLVTGVTEKIESVAAIVTANKVENDNYRDVVAEQTRKNSTDVDAAVKAAFAASTLAVTQQNIANALASDKQGAAFTKDIEKLTVSLAQIQKSSDDKLEEVRKNNDQRVNDIKDRIGQMEARSGVSDPATARALQEMASSINNLLHHDNVNSGRTQQSADGWKMMLAVGTIGIALAGVLISALVHR